MANSLYVPYFVYYRCKLWIPTSGPCLLWFQSLTLLGSCGIYITNWPVFTLAKVCLFLISISFFSTPVSIPYCGYISISSAYHVPPLSFYMHLYRDTADKFWPAVKFGSAIGKICICILMPKCYAPRCNRILVYYCRHPLQRMSRDMCIICFASSDCSCLCSAAVICFMDFCLWPHPALSFPHLYFKMCAINSIMICLYILPIYAQTLTNWWYFLLTMPFK